ncbi:unnamed protein product, partial [Iphiclides podalirius]
MRPVKVAILSELASLSSRAADAGLDREGDVSTGAFRQCTPHSEKAGFDGRRRAFPCKVCPAGAMSAI